METGRTLIEEGAKIEGNEDALFTAAKRDCEKVRLLLENGADPQKLPNIHPDEGELFELASSYGVQPTDAADSGELVYLCRGDRGGNPVAVRRLLGLGTDVNFQDHKGKTALHRASRSGFLETIRILLANGASVKIEDPKGETPLFDAIRSTIRNNRNKNGAVRLLLEAGANPLHANGKGETPLSVAQNATNPEADELATMLRSCS
jgi:hypothetical protein